MTDKITDETNELRAELDAVRSLTPADAPDLDEIAAKWLRLCGACDTGLVSCVCPAGDPRNVISNLIDEVKRARAERDRYRARNHEVTRWANAELDAARAELSQVREDLTRAEAERDDVIGRDVLTAFRTAWSQRDKAVDERSQLQVELSQVQRERDEARRDLAETRQRLWGLANAVEALAARMHAADPLNKRADRVWARELREAIAAAAAETAPETGASDPDVVEVWKSSGAYAENERRYAAEHRHDEARAALAALRTEVGVIADEAVRQIAMGANAEKATTFRTRWLLEGATTVWADLEPRLRALVTDQSPAAQSRPDVDHRAQYWALRALVALQDEPPSAGRDEREARAWQRAKDVIAATDAAYAAWRDWSPTSNAGGETNG